MSAELRYPAVISRVAASLIGTWLFTWGFTVLGISLAVMTGMPYLEAETLFHLLAFLVFLGLFLWSYATESTARAWLVLAGGGAVMTAAAWLIAPTVN